MSSFFFVWQSVYSVLEMQGVYGSVIYYLQKQTKVGRGNYHCKPIFRLYRVDQYNPHNILMGVWFVLIREL
jgi:hypothetical protein